MNAVPGIPATTTGPLPPSQHLWSPGYNSGKTVNPFLLELLAEIIIWSPGPCCQSHHCILASLPVDSITVTMATATFSHLIATASTVFCCPIQVPFLTSHLSSCFACDWGVSGDMGFPLLTWESPGQTRIVDHPTTIVATAAAATDLCLRIWEQCNQEHTSVLRTSAGAAFSSILRPLLGPLGKLTALHFPK